MKFRFLSYFLPIPIILSLTACGGGSGTGDQNTSPQGTVQTAVSSVYPELNANQVAVDTAISFTVNKALDPDSITTDTFSVSNADGTVAGSVQYDAESYTATYKPDNSLAYDTAYTAIVTKDLKDEAGNALEQDYTWQFTTAVEPAAAPLTVQSTNPADKAKDVATNATQITVKFNKAINDNSLTSDTFYLSNGSPIAGTISYNAETYEATFSADVDKLDYATTYNAAVTTGVQDLAGNALASGYTWEFTTGPEPDITGPKIANIFPQADSTNVPLNTPITVEFSEAVDLKSVHDGTFYIKDVPGTVTYSAIENKFVFTPQTSLKYSTTYKVYLTSGIKDLTGNGLESYQWQFTTAADANNNPVTIKFTYPKDYPVYISNNSTVSIQGSASSDVNIKEVKWSVGNKNGVANGTTNWSANNIALQQGNNAITVTAYDDNNKKNSDTLYVTYQPQQQVQKAESCMWCHNQTTTGQDDYSGDGIENPHPFGSENQIRCTKCHGGNGDGVGKDNSHVPPPTAMNSDQKLINDPKAYFNRLTLTGLDKQYGEYTGPDGETYTGLDYLRFINPGDLRVVKESKGCGECHDYQHGDWVSRSPIATSAGIFSGATYAAGIENMIPEHKGLFQDTAADLGFRAVSYYNLNTTDIGAVDKLMEFPVHSHYGNPNGDPNGLWDPDATGKYKVADLPFDLYTAAEYDGTRTNRIKENSNLSRLYMEQIAFTCGDCHLGSAGANNRYGDFRSSGCSACHMPYSLDGRSRTKDKNRFAYENEPANPDAIAAPERPHLETHVIRNVSKTLPNGNYVTGIPDTACVGCHQGSNRTVLQYWGIRLDQNQDVADTETQYPANPVRFEDTAENSVMYNKVAGNTTFNGRIAPQYLDFEDYDGDLRDDTPPDVHRDAGLGCIDCHGSRDLHNGTEGDQTSGQIFSRHEQAVSISCESCHGTIEEYAKTVSCTTYAGTTAQCAVDKKGNPLRHVTKDDNNNYHIISRLYGDRKYIPQTKDTVYDTGRQNDITRLYVYNESASYAMGRYETNQDLSNGIGPEQANFDVTDGFSHTDSMDCVSCHASWTNACIGCHLGGEYNDDENSYFFSNITGDRIVYNQTNADFVYQSPIPFYLGVNSDNKITQISPAEKVFYRYTDSQGNTSQVFAFSDRNGNGNNPDPDNQTASPFPALGHNVMMAHSIRGKVTKEKEGPRYCVACHLTTDGLANFANTFGDNAYTDFRKAMADATNPNDFAFLNNPNFFAKGGKTPFQVLTQHIGQNPGNGLNSPLFVHMVAGLGTGLFLFDNNGCPVNNIDNNTNRQYCLDAANNNVSPATLFDTNGFNNVTYNLDRIVQPNGTSNASNNHPVKQQGDGSERYGAKNQNLAGPLGSVLIKKLTDPAAGKVLDSWIDADGVPQGNAAAILNNN